MLPPSATYLVHPVLASHLQQVTPDFVRNVDTRNLIAPGAAWRDDDGMRFVAQGDIHGYSLLMADPGAAQAFSAFFRRLVDEACIHLQFASVARGDDVLIVDHSAHHVIRALREHRRQLARARISRSASCGSGWIGAKSAPCRTPRAIRSPAPGSHCVALHASRPWRGRARC